jgi:molybdopterin-guanine dinucleotide biosynthesis protein A
MTNTALLCGLILNGGTSSRMGTPKGEINFHTKPQQQYLFELLSMFCKDVYISVKQTTTPYPFQQIEDQLAIETPLNGIFSALNFSSTSGWLVVANDMPLVDNETLRDLIEHRDSSKVATCYYDSSGNRPEPLVSIWEPAALPLLKAFVDTGGVSPRTFLESNDVKLVTIKNRDALLNINSQEDLSQFRKKDQKS